MAELRSAAVERPQNNDRRAQVVRIGHAVVPVELEASLVDDFRAQDRGFSHLYRVTIPAHAISAGNDIKASDTGVVNVGMREAIAHRKRIVCVDLIIEARAYCYPALRRAKHGRIGIDNGKSLGIEHDGVDDVAVVDGVALDVREEGGPLSERSAEIASEFMEPERRLLPRIRIAG